MTLEEIDRTADLSAVFADKWYGENNRKLWNALLAGRRFRAMRYNYYRERIEEEQGGAVRSGHFFPEGCEPVVAFRGTDDSVVGWKEDFRLAFRKPLASQEMSSVCLKSGRSASFRERLWYADIPKAETWLPMRRPGRKPACAQDYGHL